MDALSIRLQLSNIPADRLVSVDGRVLCAAGELLSVLGGPIEDKPPVVKRRLLDALNIRWGPDVSTAKLGVLPAGAVIAVLDKVISGYYKIAEQPGYISANPTWSEVYQPPVVVPPAPQPKPTEDPALNASKIGFHIMPGNNQDGLLGLLRNCYVHNKAVRGVTLVRMGWQSELTPSQIKQASPLTKVLQRWYHAEWEGVNSAIDWNRADLFQAGINQAQSYYNRFLNHESQNAVDWHQIINEPYYGPGTASFWLGAMQEADRLGFKLAVGCFAVGNPQLPEESPFWGSMYAVLRYAKEHGHVLLLHEYTMPDRDQDWLNKWVMHRYLKVYAAFPPELQDLPLILGEYGQLGLNTVDSDYLIGKLKLVQPILASSPQVLFAALWTYGGGGAWQNDLIDRHLPELGGYLNM